MKRYLAQALALILVVWLGITGCSGASLMTGNYSQDALSLVSSLQTAIALPEGSQEKAEAQAEARQLINEFASRYRRDSSVASLSSFTTMQTALNGLASHYSSYPNRPLPDKLKERLAREFKQVEIALRRES